LFISLTIKDVQSLLGVKQTSYCVLEGNVSACIGSDT
jgi:hypothetical protein